MEKRERNFLVVKYGAYACGVLSLILLLLYVLAKGLSLFQNILFITLGAEIYLCCNEYKRKGNSHLSYKEAFAIGWQVSFFTGLMSSLLLLLFIEYVGRAESIAYLSRYKGAFIQEGKLTESNMDEALNMMVNPFFVFFTTNIFYLIIGFFLSILIAFFVSTPTTTYSNEE